MEFSFVHANINVLDLEKSLEFYKKALFMQEGSRIKEENGAFELVYLTDKNQREIVELTWIADKKEPYELGDNESHLAFSVQDFEAAKRLHQEMNVICYENPEMGIYFIEDPDGYWLEILPENR